MALNKDGVRITGQIGPHNFNDDYPTHDAQWGLDGMRSCLNEAEMLAIKRKRRKKGMLVAIPKLDEQSQPILNGNGHQLFTVYQLVNNPTSAATTIDDWEEFQASGGADKHYTHSQAMPSQAWTVQHNLDKKVAVWVEDINVPGVLCRPAIEHVDSNTVIVHIGNFAMAGYAYCN